MKNWLIGGIFILAVVLGAVIYQNFGGSTAVLSGAELDWRQLSEMDYITGKAPKELEALNGKPVKIPGFMVPLEDDQRAVTEFLLVPNAQACIHVPPPPPNQMVYVKMKKGTASVVEPIWVYGTFNIVTKNSQYGDASFEIIGEGVELYK
ncbi:DUF3299 domain-containing protein [Bdellovibrio sp. NC01]|uniref:DUF3299 domain-containing protein n=1 Tax=Bdellovibrio sp. NC01 TaxID=2220073 RepID=UPI00115AC408|nr:DUF3299 domain-containing protein [Bdellovibrio sp. NC01]QDK37036.1 hypothetical protein DOE51_05220 [Bdellovibrio sp. NC01]